VLSARKVTRLIQTVDLWKRLWELYGGKIQWPAPRVYGTHRGRVVEGFRVMDGLN
jgi:hypothetical protein